MTRPWHAVGNPESFAIDLDGICRVAAQEMLAVALLAERRAYLDANASALDATGKRLVVGNGYARPRQVTTGAGMVEVKAPRVDDRREGEHFGSVDPACLHAQVPQGDRGVADPLPAGPIHGDFAPGPRRVLRLGRGPFRLERQPAPEAWQDEHERWSGRDLSGVDYVYWWADGVHFNVRLEEDRLCCLVIVGVRPDGTKELVALADGYRESKESWAGPIA